MIDGGNDGAERLVLSRHMEDGDRSVDSPQDKQNGGSSFTLIPSHNSDRKRCNRDFTLYHQSVDNVSRCQLLPPGMKSQDLCELEIANICRVKSHSGNTEIWNLMDDFGLQPLPERKRWPFLERDDCEPCVFENQSCENEVEDDDCVMDSDDWDDSNIPQLDGTSDEKPVSKKSKKRVKTPKVGSSQIGAGSEEGSSQGEGSSLSASPVQSPQMLSGRDGPSSRDQAVTSPYLQHHGYPQHQGGYFRHQQWGEMGTPANNCAMPSYRGYHSVSVGWGQSPPSQSLHPGLHRPPGNNYGYLMNCQRYPYSPAFGQNGSQQQQTSFSPPSHARMSPSSYPNSASFSHSHTNPNPQQYGHFMSPQMPGMSTTRPWSEDSVSHQTAQFSSPNKRQYPGPGFSGWEYPKGMNAGRSHNASGGPANALCSGISQGQPSASTQGITASILQSGPTDLKTCYSSEGTSTVVSDGMSARDSCDSPSRKSPSSQCVPLSLASSASGNKPTESMDFRSVGSSSGMTAGSNRTEVVSSVHDKTAESVLDVQTGSQDLSASSQDAHGMSPCSMASGSQHDLFSESSSELAGSANSLSCKWWPTSLPCGPSGPRSSIQSTGAHGKPAHTQNAAGQPIHLQNISLLSSGHEKSSQLQNNAGNTVGEEKHNVVGQEQPGPWKKMQQNPDSPGHSGSAPQIFHTSSGLDHHAPLHTISETSEQSDVQNTGQTVPLQNSSLNYKQRQMNLVQDNCQKLQGQRQDDFSRTSSQRPAGQQQLGSVWSSSQIAGHYGHYQSSVYRAQQDCRQFHVPTSPPAAISGQTNSSLSDHNRWQNPRKSSPTLQALLKSSGTNMAMGSNHTGAARRTMSVDCPPSDFVTSPPRGTDSNTVGTPAFKYPQKRSGSFSAPSGFMSGGGGQSALSNLYNFVSNVDSKARAPTPTSRNSTPAPASTPSSTPNSGPSPSSANRIEESTGIMDMATSPETWHNEQTPAFQPSSSTTQIMHADEASVSDSNIKHLPVPTSPSILSDKASFVSTVSKEQVVNYNLQHTHKQSVSLQTDDSDEILEEIVMKQNKEIKYRDASVGSGKDSKDSGNQTLPYNNSDTRKENPYASQSGGSAVSSVRSERLGKASRMKKLGLNLIRTRQFSEDGVGNPSSTPTACAAYSFTFHVPTPVYKRFKMRMVFSEKFSEDVRFVRMHPMEARRYSLLKISQELVRLKRLSPQDLTKKQIASSTECPDDRTSCTDKHNSLIDPHTGESLFPLPVVKEEDGSKDSRKTSDHVDKALPNVQSPSLVSEPVSSQVDKTMYSMQSPSLLSEPDCRQAQSSEEGICPSRANSDSYLMDSGHETQSRSGSDMLLTPESLSYSVNTMSTCDSPNDSLLTSESGGSSSQNWQTLDRDRRPSVKVEYPAQHSTNLEQWACGQPPNAWTGGVHATGQWCEQWQSGNQPPMWNSGVNGGQAYFPGPVDGCGPKQPWTPDQYECKSWSGPQAVRMAPMTAASHLIPSSSQSVTVVPSANQRHMNPTTYSSLDYPGYNRAFHQQDIYSPNELNGSNKMYMCPPDNNMGPVHFSYQGFSPQSGCQSRQVGGSGGFMYKANSGYHPQTEGKLLDPKLAFVQQQGGMLAQYQQNQYDNSQSTPNNPGSFQPDREYFPHGPYGPLHSPPHQFSSSSNPAHFNQLMCKPREFTSDKFPPPSGQYGSSIAEQSQFAHQHLPPASASQSENLSLNCKPNLQDQSLDSQQNWTIPSSIDPPSFPENTNQKQLSMKSQNCLSVSTAEHVSQVLQGTRESLSADMTMTCDSSANCSFMDTVEGGHFLHRAACQASTSTVDNHTLDRAENMQLDRPGSTKNSGQNNSNLSFSCTNPDIKSKFGSYSDKDGNGDGCKALPKSSECRIRSKSKSPNSTENRSQKLVNGVSPPPRQTVRRSSVQLWSDGDSDSGEEDTNESGGSSDDYQPSCNTRHRGQKRKNNRRTSLTKIKRAKRASVNYDAHAFSKYLGHGCEKKSVLRSRHSQNLNVNVKKTKKKGKESSLIEGVHYIVVGKFKGHRVMLVKVNRVKVRLDERVKVSDWQRRGEHGQSKPKNRLQGPRCRRLAKGSPANDPSFVHNTEKKSGSETPGIDSDTSTIVEDSVTPESSIDKAQSSSCTKKKEVSCGTKTAEEEMCSVAFVKSSHVLEHSDNVGKEGDSESKCVCNGSQAKLETGGAQNVCKSTDPKTEAALQQSENNPTADRNIFCCSPSKHENSVVAADPTEMKNGVLVVGLETSGSALKSENVQPNKLAENQNDPVKERHKASLTPDQSLRPVSDFKSGSEDAVDRVLLSDLNQQDKDSRGTEGDPLPWGQSSITVQVKSKPMERMPSPVCTQSLSTGREGNVHDM